MFLFCETMLFDGALVVYYNIILFGNVRILSQNVRILFEFITLSGFVLMVLFCICYKPITLSGLFLIINFPKTQNIFILTLKG